MLPFTPSAFVLRFLLLAHAHRCQESGVTTDATPPGQPSAVSRCPFVSLVALLTWRDLLFRAKHLFVAAMVAGSGGLPALRKYWA